MARLRLAAVLLAALSLLLPLAAPLGARDVSCADCLSCTDGCPPSCCPCCVHAPALAGVARAQERLVLAGLTGSAAAVRPLPSEPRSVFHVPKAFPI
jgi:hypothetical protein